MCVIVHCLALLPLSKKVTGLNSPCGRGPELGKRRKMDVCVYVCYSTYYVVLAVIMSNFSHSLLFLSLGMFVTTKKMLLYN